MGGGNLDSRTNARGLDIGKENESKQLYTTYNICIYDIERQQFKLLSTKLSKLLCLLKLTINSRQFFRELLVDYQDIIHKVKQIFVLYLYFTAGDQANGSSEQLHILHEQSNNFLPTALPKHLREQGRNH